MMKKALFPLMFLFVVIVSGSVLAASVSRSSLSRVSPGETFTVTLSASGIPAGEIYTIEDTVPQGWLVSNWQVNGAEGGREAVDYRMVAADNRHGWSLTVSSSSVTVTYDVKVPANANGAYNFDAVYFDSSGQGRSAGAVTVRTIACGDGVCEGSENSDSCEADCPRPAPAAPSQPDQPAGGVEAPSESEGGSATTTLVFAVIIVLLLAAFFLYSKRKQPPVPSGKAGRKR